MTKNEYPHPHELEGLKLRLYLKFQSRNWELYKDNRQIYWAKCRRFIEDELPKRIIKKQGE